MLDWLYYYRYPQYKWIDVLNEFLHHESIGELDDKTIIDAPCGDGIVSYWLSQKNPKLQFELFDLNETFVKRCNKYLPLAKSTKVNLFEATFEKDNNIWLFINSLYCLPDVDRLMTHFSPSMEYIIGVFPYIDHMNYKMYFRNNPDTDRPSELNKADTLGFFRKYGYELIEERRRTAIPYYAISLPVINTFKSRFLNLVDPFISDHNGAYWIALFKKAAKKK